MKQHEKIIDETRHRPDCCQYCGCLGLTPHSKKVTHPWTLTGPVKLIRTSWKCVKCERHSTCRRGVMGGRRGRYTTSIVVMAQGVMRALGTLIRASRHIEQTYGITIPQQTLHEWRLEDESYVRQGKYKAFTLESLRKSH